MSDSEDLVAHMRPVLAAERDLRELAVVWQMIESSAAIGCPGEAEAILGTLNDTRNRFDQLQRRLIEQMVVENRAEIGDDLRDNAQCTIDILVRNLYERTADVGFLATDDAVREFCAGSAEQREAGRAAMVRRLAQYQAKYTVYDDIILLSTTGVALARLDADASGDAADPAIAAAAQSVRGYVERFGPSPLAPSGTSALLYAHAIHGADGGLVGTLVLRFRFADEMQRIFDSMLDGSHRVALALVNADGRVIATGDEAHVPLGARLHVGKAGEVELTSFAGREYLSICCASHGYQGYAGPPWRAVAMVSLLTAFRSRSGQGDTDVPLDNPELMAVQTEADAINRDLRRVLWNGSVLIESQQAEAPRLKAVLRQVTIIGRRTRGRVSEAIHDIYRVSLARSRHQTQQLARLAADLMDRNLYERANDCRWWALSPVLQRELSQPPTDTGAEAMQRVLAHINSLYTVYSQLVVFDAGGVIRAVSVASTANRWVGQRVPEHWLQPLKTRIDPQAYAVTPFEQTELHDDGPTYVYLAAIHGGAPQRLVGGIGIVFHSTRELGTMLRELIGDRPGFAAFVDAAGNVLVSAGSVPPVVLEPGMGADADGAVVEHEGSHFVCARVRAPGYREFKTVDGYDNGVEVVVGLRLGASERRQSSFSDVDLVAASAGGQQGSVEMAVFQIGAARYALPAADVIESIPLRALARMPSVGGATLGVVEVSTPSGPRMVRVVCGRKLFGVDYPARSTDGVVVVMRPTGGDDRTMMGLRVDDVLSVIDVAPANVHPVPEGLARHNSWLDGLIDCEARAADRRDPALVQLLSRERLVGDLCGLAITEDAAAG
jgi:chemotaxis signal transduction protein